MSASYPELPGYGFSWRSIQIEPVPVSGERITLGAIVKGDNQELLAAKVVSKPHLRKIYGREFGARIAEALSLCINHAEKYYSTNPLSNKWSPPLDRFYVGELHSSVAENIEEGLSRAARQSSSFSVSLEEEKTGSSTSPAVSAPKSWQKAIRQVVTDEREEFLNYFEKSVPVRDSGVPLTFSFLSSNYAAQFDAITETKQIQRVLVRAQSKLWQLDRLRDESALIHPKFCELLLQIPDSDETSEVSEFVEELDYEASRRELGLFSTTSPVDAARHLIEKAA
ncbi:MAG: hypothetical protein OXE42_01850 [Gammaproteobacteria bacterium]|nr:hypothetical protein [Gammaproteobacteria bacterium]